MEGNDRIMLVSGIVVLVMILGSAFAFGANEGENDPNGTTSNGYVGGLDLQVETISEGGIANLGQAIPFNIPQGTRIIKNITAVLTWVDETERPGMPRLRRYDNQPDTFSLSMLCPHGNITETSGSNPMNGEGMLQLEESHEDEDLDLEIGHMLDSGNTTLGDWTVEIELTTSGMWLPQLPPRLIGYRDESNAYVLVITIEFYDLAEVLGD